MAATDAITGTSGSSEGGLADHVETYGGFVHLVRWVGAHVLIDVAGIISLIEGNVPLGLFLIACGTALLIWTVVTTRRAGEEARTQMDATAVETDWHVPGSPG